MLNIKLVQKSLLVNGFLFLTIAMANAGAQKPDSLQHIQQDTTAQLLRFDPELLVISGLPGSDLLNAPSIKLNKQATKYVDDFIIHNGKILQEIKDKRGASFNTIDQIFSDYDLPLELKYLAVVESELKTTALSRVGARGAWQMMPSTARLFNLKIKGKYDERTHLYKSTVAAAKYLDYLHDMFGDWLLVIAAYNAGPGSVYKAIKKSGSRNFWKLQYFLPAETRGHVKKFIGTQYFFEGEAGVTSLTKDETDMYSRRMMAYVEKQNLLLSDKQVAKTNDETGSNTTPIANSSGDPVTVVKAANVGEMRIDEEE